MRRIRPLQSNPADLPGSTLDGRIDSVAAWAKARLGSIDHETRVAELALWLAGQTADRHRLRRRDLSLLALACYLHDVGRAVDDERHPSIGARQVRDDRTLRLTPDERATVAYLVRRHRGRIRLTGDRWHEAVSDKRRAAVLLALLRAADVLDSRRHATTPALRFDGGVLSVHFAQPKAHRKLIAKRHKFALICQTLQIHVDLHTGGIQRVAA